MKFIIRSANSTDAKALCEAERFWAAKPGHLVSLPEELKVDAFAKRIDQLTKDSIGRYIVIENEDGQIAGHALLDPMGLTSLSHIVRLTIVVHPGYEGNGVGKSLMDALINWAKASPHVEKIELLVRATNLKAIALYNKYGFVEEGRHRHRIKISTDKYIDDIAMGLMIV